MNIKYLLSSYTFALLLAGAIVFTSHAQTCIENKLTGEELSNIDENTDSYTFSSKEYYTKADVSITKIGPGPSLLPYSDEGIWIGRGNGQVDYSDVTLRFSKPVVSVSVLLIHFNNDKLAGQEEMQRFTVYTDKDENLSSSTLFVWATGPAAGYAPSMAGATTFHDSTHTISAAANVCCEFGSGRLTISNKTPFSKITFRHQDLGVLPNANGIVFSDLAFCVYVPAPEKKQTEALSEKITEKDEPEIITSSIFFDFDKAILRADAALELDKFIALYHKHPQLTLEINSFSDCRGNTSYNNILSDKRAESAVNYLISHGMPTGQVKKNGLGESNKQACDCEAKESACPEKEYEVNRRTEIRVASY